MKAKKMFSMVAVAVFVSAAPAAAQGQVSPWSVSFGVGMERGISGDVHGAGTGTVLGLPTQVGARGYDTIYGNGFQWNAALGYAVSPSGEVRVRFDWARHEAERIQVGSVATFQLFGQFDTQQAMGLDVGYRQYFTPRESRVRPFVGGQVGFTRVDPIQAEFTVPAANVTLSDVNFYDASTAATFGLGGGLYLGLSDRVGVHADVDLRWRGDLKAVDGLAGTGLEPINDKSRRWSMPVSFGATIRF